MTISWDYEEGATDPYYHVYVVNGPLDNNDHEVSIVLTIPQTSEYDKQLQVIVDALTRIENKMTNVELATTVLSIINYSDIPKGIFSNVTTITEIPDFKTKENVMYFVYEGYVSSDNCDTSYGPTYTLTAYNTVADVIEAKKEFENRLHKECQYAIFRVIEGVEKNMTPKEKIVEWELT